MRQTLYHYSKIADPDLIQNAQNKGKKNLPTEIKEEKKRVYFL